jgi:hypothetical protein
MTDLQKLVEQCIVDAGPFQGGKRIVHQSDQALIVEPIGESDLYRVGRLAMQYAAEEAAKTLMEMHAGAKGQHNYYHFAANKIRERFKAL